MNVLHISKHNRRVGIVVDMAIVNRDTVDIRYAYGVASAKNLYVCYPHAARLGNIEYRTSRTNTLRGSKGEGATPYVYIAAILYKNGGSLGIGTYHGTVARKDDEHVFEAIENQGLL